MHSRENTFKQTYLVLFLLASLFVFTSCFGGSDSTKDTNFESDVLDPDLRGQGFEVISIENPPEDTLVWFHDQEPVNLHPDHPDNLGTLTTAWVNQGLLDGLFGIDKNLQYYPELLKSIPEPVKNKDGKVVINYELRPNLIWSDGKPLTSEDVKYTFDIFVEGCKKESDNSILDSGSDGCYYEMTSRSGYNLITSFEVKSTTNFTITFASVYPDWKGLFPFVYAKHAYGENSLEVNKRLENFKSGDDYLPISGPIKLTNWDKGISMDFETNGNYHGSQSPDLQSKDTPRVPNFRIRFLPNLASINKNIMEGKGHFIFTDVSTTFSEVSSSDDITPASNGGDIFEHMGMSLANAHLQSNTVREAVASAVDKKEVMEKLYTPIFGENLIKEGLGNSYWMSNNPNYENHQPDYLNANLDRVNTLMGEAGYSKNAEGIWTHPEKGKIELRSVTVSNDSFRVAQQKIISDQLIRAGFSITNQNLVGGEFFTTSSSGKGPFASKTTWDLALFSWKSGPWPGAQSSAYGGKASPNNINNIYGYSNSKFDSAAKKCDQLLAVKDQSGCYNDLDKYVTQSRENSGIFIVPISQKPFYYAYRNDLISSGIVVSNEFGGPFINIGDFSFK